MEVRTGERLRRWLLHCGITKHELALLLDTSDQQVGRWVNDDVELRFTTLKRILDALNVSLEDFDAILPAARNVAEPGFGDRLADAIVRAGMTQRTVAAALGVHGSTVGRWINANRAPEDAAQLHQLANLLSVSAGFLLGRPVSASMANARPDQESLLDDWFKSRVGSTKQAGIVKSLLSNQRRLPLAIRNTAFLDELAALIDSFYGVGHDDQDSHERRRQRA